MDKGPDSCIPKLTFVLFLNGFCSFWFFLSGVLISVCEVIYENNPAPYDLISAIFSTILKTVQAAHRADSGCCHPRQLVLGVTRSCFTT